MAQLIAIYFGFAATVPPPRSEKPFPPACISRFSRDLMFWRRFPVLEAVRVGIDQLPPKFLSFTIALNRLFLAVGGKLPEIEISGGICLGVILGTPGRRTYLFISSLNRSSMRHTSLKSATKS